MTSPVAVMNNETAVMLDFLDVLLAADWSTASLVRCAKSRVRRPNIYFRESDSQVSEVQIVVAGDGAMVLAALCARLGPNIELAGIHRRINRWLVGDQEVLLDSSEGGLFLHLTRSSAQVPG